MPGPIPTAPARRRLARAAVVWVLGLTILRATLWAPEVCPDFTADAARSTALAAADWVVANQDPDGRYRYAWDRAAGTASQDYNLVRHAGVTMSLYQLVVAGQLEYLAAADRGLGWMLDRRIETAGGGTAFTDGPQAKLGAAALLSVSLAHRRLATADTAHDETMLALGRFLVGQQRGDGSMGNLYDRRTGDAVPDATSLYSTGEALWALAMTHEAFPGNGFDAAAWSTLDYLATERDRDEAWAPAPWADQWAAYSMREMVEWGLDDVHLDYARSLAARFGFLIRTDAQRGTTYGGWTHGPTPRASGVGTWIEGLGALRAVMVAEPRLAESIPTADRTLACGAARLAEAQVTPGPGVDPALGGAWFFEDETRMDDQQHAASAMLLAEPVLP